MTKRLILVTALGFGMFSACSEDTAPTTSTGGTTSKKTGGSISTGGSTETGGAPVATGGITATGGAAPISTGGIATGGLAATGGRAATGGTPMATGGSAPVTTGGIGAATGGNRPGPDAGTGTGGNRPTDAGTPTGGIASDGGTPPVGGSTPFDCNTPMPTSGGTQHCGSYRTGKAGTLAWELWSNQYNSNACITYYSTPAFSAKWSNNSDFLARVGIEWGGKALSTLGTVTADFSVKKSGDSGGYSYIGIYGWAKQPCTEYYIIDDSMRSMPFKPYSMAEKGSATIDGEVYKFYSGSFGGTGGSRCTTPFTQNWSVRQKARSCGTISISQHFEAWAKVGMGVDQLLEAKVLVEAGGGTGSAEFPVANVKAVAK